VKTSLYKRLLPFLRPHAWRMAVTIAANLLAALLDGFAIALLIPFLNILFHQPSTSLKSGWVSKLLNATVGSQIIPGDEMRSLRNVILLVMASVLLKNLLVWIAGQFGATLQEFVTRDLRNAVYRHLAHLPLGYFTQMKAGQILSRVINDTFEARLILTQIVTQGLQAASLVIVYIAILFSISWKLTLIALIILPLLGLSLQPMLRRLRKGNLRRGNVHGEMTSVLQETISGIRLVKASGTESYEEARFADGSNKYARSSLKMTRLALVAPPVTEVIGTLIAVLVLWVGALQVLQSSCRRCVPPHSRRWRRPRDCSRSWIRRRSFSAIPEPATRRRSSAISGSRRSHSPTRTRRFCPGSISSRAKARWSRSLVPVDQGRARWWI